MASAHRQVGLEYFEKTVIESRETVTGVTLDLSPNEAQFLADLFSVLSGHPTKSRRGLADQIAAALESVGFHYSTSMFNPGKNTDTARCYQPWDIPSGHIADAPEHLLEYTK